MGKFLGAIKCSEFCRQWFIWICAILHVSLLIGAALLIVAALYVEFSFTEYLAIIGFKIGYTPLLLEAFGAVGVLVSFGGFFTLITSLYPDKRSSTNMILLGYTIGVWIPIAGHIFLLVTLTRDSKATSQQGLSYVVETSSYRHRNPCYHLRHGRRRRCYQSYYHLRHGRHRTAITDQVVQID